MRGCRRVLRRIGPVALASSARGRAPGMRVESYGGRSCWADCELHCEVDLWRRRWSEAVTRFRVPRGVVASRAVARRRDQQVEAVLAELLGQVETDPLDAPVMRASGRASEVVMQRSHPNRSGPIRLRRVVDITDHPLQRGGADDHGAFEGWSMRAVGRPRRWCLRTSGLASLSHSLTQLTIL